MPQSAGHDNGAAEVPLPRPALAPEPCMHILSRTPRRRALKAGAQRSPAVDGQARQRQLLGGPILPTLVRFALPNMAAILATALAAIAETAFVGTMGVASLAGMALVFPMVMLQQMLSAGAMGGGVSSAVSRALGAGDTGRANALAVHALWIGLAAGLLGTAAMLACGPALYALLGGRGEALAQAVAYSNVAFVGAVGMWLLNTCASVIRGSGNMRVPSATLLVVAAAQVLVGGACGLGWFGLPRGGMAGLALGQVVACLSPLQTVLTILVLTGLVARFGTDALAGYAIGVASVPLVGMAIGAGQVQRARRVAWTAAFVAFAVLGALGLLLAVVPGLWTVAFTQDPAVRAAAATYFHWVGPSYGLFGLGLCLYFSSLGAGHALGPVMAGTLRLLLVASGGWLLAEAQAAPWTIFALASLGMAAYGLATAGAVHVARWGARA